MRLIATSFLVLFMLFFPKTSYADKAQLIIFMTENGFEPQEVVVKRETRAIFVNKDKVSRWPASNIHPTHGIYPEFDPKKPVELGQSWAFIFQKEGIFKYHDHILPHLKGTITVNPKDSDKRVFMDFLLRLKENILGLFSRKEKKINKSFVVWERLIEEKGVAYTWKSFRQRYFNNDSVPANVHDIAHYIGARIYEKEELLGIVICDSSFGFGCYHGFSEAAFAKNLRVLSPIEKACERVGRIASGPWASCIHGIGHGVATYFDTSKLDQALLACNKLKNGQTYCYDGVFMEFSRNAPVSFYKQVKKDPLFPCSNVEDVFKPACARSQPTVLSKYLNLPLIDIMRVCLNSLDSTIREYCLLSIGHTIAQENYKNPKSILENCNLLADETGRAQCVWAAAEELVFQNYNGWEKNAPFLCNTLSGELRKTCNSRLSQTIASYRK